MDKKEIIVLDKGFVKLIEWSGSDQMIFQAARQSVNKDVKDDEDPQRQIRDLMRWEHTQPFEFASITFQIKLPIFVARQVVRHRTAKILEISGRYTELPTEFYVPNESEVTFKDPTISEKMTVHNVKNPDDWWDCLTPEQIEQDWSWSDHFKDEQEILKNNYTRWVKSGCRKELSRINLPLSTYTQWYWKMDLHNLFHFLKLRLSDHAQWETRQYANAILDLIKPLYPHSCQAFEDYVLGSVKFSRAELNIIKDLIYDDRFTFDPTYKKYNITDKEKKEFLNKLAKI